MLFWIRLPTLIQAMEGIGLMIMLRMMIMLGKSISVPFPLTCYAISYKSNHLTIIYLCSRDLLQAYDPHGEAVNWKNFSSTVIITKDMHSPLPGSRYTQPTLKIYLLICQLHDDIIKWKDFPCYWPYVRGINQSQVNSLHKGQWRGVLMFSLICVWTKGWQNNREAGDLRRYRTHYDVIVMYYIAAPYSLNKLIQPWDTHNSWGQNEQVAAAVLG